MGKIIPKDIEVVVGSYGGVGTTFFLDFVAQFKKTNHPSEIPKLKIKCVSRGRGGIAKLNEVFFLKKKRKCVSNSDEVVARDRFELSTSGL